MKTAFRWLIQCYRWFISPMLGPRCRFFPSCSVYALEALEQHSLWFALWLIIKRIGRCNPWGGSGYDPVPPKSGSDPKSTDCKKNSILKEFFVKFFAMQQICDCEADHHRFYKQDVESIVNGHQIRKFTPYTNPPHHHSLRL